MPPGVTCSAFRRHGRDVVTVRESLTVSRMLWCGDSRLVEGYGFYQAHAFIPDVGRGKGPIIDRLPLDVQVPILGIGQLVARVIATELKCRGPARQCREVRQACGKGLKALPGRRRSRAKGVCEGGAARGGNPYNRRRLQRSPEGSFNSTSGSGRELSKELATIVVHAESGADHNILHERRAPGDAEAWRNPPLASG